jgi:hypothetical protein
LKGTSGRIQYSIFELAREYVHSLGLKNKTDWEKNCRLHKLPNYIPTHPDREYKKNWNGWGDWLGYEESR